MPTSKYVTTQKYLTLQLHTDDDQLFVFISRPRSLTAELHRTGPIFRGPSKRDWEIPSASGAHACSWQPF